jgi:hypothetical protein
MVKLSTYERTYDKEIILDKDLLCLAHPIQISVDPTVCLLGNSIWTKISKQTPPSQPVTALDLVTDVSKIYSKEISTIINAIKDGNNNENGQIVINTIRSIANGSTPITNLQILNKEFQLNNPQISYKLPFIQGSIAGGDKITLYQYINIILTSIDGGQINYALGIDQSTKEEEKLKRILK